MAAEQPANTIRNAWPSEWPSPSRPCSPSLSCWALSSNSGGGQVIRPLSTPKSLAGSWIIAPRRGPTRCASSRGLGVAGWSSPWPSWLSSGCWWAAADGSPCSSCSRLGERRFSVLVQDVVGWDRPPVDIRLQQAHSSAFPSGHSTQAAATYFARDRGHDPRPVAVLRAVTWLAATLIVFLVGVSRVDLGMHWAD